MNLVLTFMLLGISGSGAKSWAQDDRITIRTGPVTMIEMFDLLRKQTNLRFVFSYDDVAPFSVDVNARNMTLAEILDTAFADKPLKYEITDSHVVISQKTEVPQAPLGRPEPARITLTGTVKGANGLPVPGVSVLIKDTFVGTTTNNVGQFSLTFVTSEGNTIVFSMLGMQRIEVPIGNRREFSVTMLEDATEVDEVVVTGMFERRKESFTGSASTYTQDDLKLYGNQNLIASLKNLDPSFIVEESVEWGSDPNRLPDMQIRGSGSITGLRGDYEGNPNQPLFIIDGFESTATQVFDLDMNRVSSVTILRDAAAKAIYGSKASNGVIVIETVLPKAGTLRVTYTGDLSITAPDLTSYHLTNAAEKLQVEVDAGRYTGVSPAQQQFQREQYNTRLNNVMRGVDTYWLSQPLRTGVGQKHAIHLEGGDDAMRYGIDASYNNVAGVMKGSDRETVSGTINLSYRYKNLIFRNVLSVGFNRADDSPYGSFSEYTQLNPYWSPYDEYGNLVKFLGTYTPNGTDATATREANPLYNAQIGTKNFSKYSEITENFYAEWQVVRNFKLTGRFGFTHNKDTREDFYPGDHTRFADYTGEDYFKRGTYSITDGESKTISVDVIGNYTGVFGRHMVIANGGWSLKDQSYLSHGMSAEGFLNNRVDDITFAKQYAENGRPSGSESVLREVGLTGAANYSYDDRYLADLSIRYNGSSAFGANNRWGTFWSAGIGWNIHRESFMDNNTFINQLKLRGSIGYTGNQNFSSFQAMRTYNFYSDRTYDNVNGAYLMALANPSLKWQQQQDLNAGVDLRMWNRLTMRVDAYIQTTDDLLIDYTVPSSTGFTSYKENIGQVRNTGIEGTINMIAYRNHEKDAFVSINVSAAHNKNKITKIYDALKNHNEEQNENGGSAPLSLYEEGQSMNSIWAVPSLGIDPITGYEIYVKNDGTTTNTWDYNDQIVAGVTDPKLRGNFGITSEYKGFGLALLFSYRIGGHYYNSTLVDRIENVDIAYNVDRRVLEGTWKNPGDIVAFKRITTSNRTTRATTRFVEKMNELSLASLSVSYDFRNLNIAKYKLERLKCSFYMNDVFRASNVKSERGLSYPFARTFSFSLTASF